MECRPGVLNAPPETSDAALGLVRPPAALNCEVSMPFFLIPFVLGLSFLLIWAIIGGMIFHDGQAVAQHDIDAGLTFGYARRLATARRTFSCAAEPS